MDKIKICTPLEGWIDIENFDIDNIKIQNIIKHIHCDTRDFHITASDTIHDKGLKDKIEYPNSVIKDIEIFKFLRNLYDKLGGKSIWQMVRNPNESSQHENWRYKNENWRYKYIRFYRITNDEFIVTDSYGNAIDYKNLLENAIANNKIDSESYF